jgi:hypothetical protein
MVKPDRRKKPLGRRSEGGGELVNRDVTRAPQCERCGGRLDMRTIPMTGEIVEECQRCGMRQPVQRFLPVAEDEQEPQRKARHPGRGQDT